MLPKLTRNWSTGLIHHNVTFSLINRRVLENTKVRMGIESLFYLYHPSFQLIFLPACLDWGFFVLTRGASKPKKIILRKENSIAALYFIRVGQPASFHELPITQRQNISLRSECYKSFRLREHPGSHTNTIISGKRHACNAALIVHQKKKKKGVEFLFFFRLPFFFLSLNYDSCNASGSLTSNSFLP